MNAYTAMFFCYFYKGENFYDFLFASMDSEMGCTLKGMNRFDRSKINKTCHRDRIARLTVPCPSHKKL